ncbi:MAG: hypothetical protein LC099_10110 [Anaerolineales bacterium]|nr:hypothetical protein [Anaerolineales bacterium]
MKKLSILIALAALLTGCLPAQQTSVNVQDQVNTAVAGTAEANQRIEQSVAETVSAQNNADAPLATQAVVDVKNSNAQDANTPTPTETPTDEPAPTDTPEPTATALVTATFTPKPTRIIPQYACSVYKKTPVDNETFSRGGKFDAKFVITNTGSHVWPTGIDFKYAGGTAFATQRIEIPVALEPGQSYEFQLDGKAPDTAGRYVMNFLVDGPMCSAYIAINVK